MVPAAGHWHPAVPGEGVSQMGLGWCGPPKAQGRCAESAVSGQMQCLLAVLAQMHPSPIVNPRMGATPINDIDNGWKRRDSP